MKYKLAVENNSECAVFISSCDAYSDAWEAFFTLFFKYWPECTFPIYFISNQKKYENDRVIPINFPENMGSAHYWAERLKTSIQNNPYRYILYLQEDYFITKPVDTKKILSLIEIMKKENAGYLRLYPSPGPDRKFKNYADIGEIDNNSKYRTSLQAALWDSKVLNTMLWKDESLWDFELTHNENCIQPFLCVRQDLFFPYISTAPIQYIGTGIQKGKWNRAIIPLFKKENIIIESSKEFDQ